MINKKITTILLILLTFFMIMSSVSASDCACNQTDNTTDNSKDTMIHESDKHFVVDPIIPLPTVGPWEDGPQL